MSGFMAGSETTNNASNIAIIHDFPLDSELYRRIAKVSYSDHVPIPKLVNDMLKEHIDVYLLWRKIGYVLVSKDVLKSSLMRSPDEELVEYAGKIASRYREAAILMQGRPSLEAYINLIKAFVSVNGYSVEKSKNGENDVLIVQFNINEKYSLFVGNAYKILLEEFAEIERFEITDNLAFFEYRKR
ncbi:MAG TPA: hypothetical protein VD736_06445 [Nitrososphaera sp.]|nr:hypothetical protein [Nitrososphaera sp.]